MRIEVLHFEGCPNHKSAVERIRQVLREEGISAELVEVSVKGPSMAQELEFLGSPSVRINGLDVEPEARTSREFGMMCRTYAIDGRREGLPSREMLRKAIREANSVIMPQRPAAREAGSSSGTGAVAASLAAIVGVLAASSCCLPVFPFMLAAGLAGTSAFLSQVRPYLLGGSILFIALGFYQARRGRKCNRRTSVVASALLWISTAFVLISIFFPQVMANAIAGR